MKPIILLLSLSAFMAYVSASPDIIDSSLKKRFLFGNTGETENVMVSFNQGIQTVLQQINALNISSISERRMKLVNASKKLADLIQKPLQKFLERMGIKFESFWISNQIVIPNVSSTLVKAIAKIPGVSKVEKEPVVKINPIRASGPVDQDIIRNLTKRQSSDYSMNWGVAKLRTDHAWMDGFKGKGIVVAGIDTGVRWTHSNLRFNYRSEYGWYDPYEKTYFPNDQNGHGTHTIGSIVGTGGLGVAPEATWIACKGCDTSSCGASQLLACGQWVLCPTRPDGSSQNCAMAPHIVSNSWGGSGGERWYDGVINSWHAAGIIPVFSIGNSGPECGTAGSPGDYGRAIAVGSTDYYDRISEFSSIGPARDGKMKPDVVAPGSDVYSAWHTSDTAYNGISGTSMACPHVSGVIALMLQKNRHLNYDQIYNILTMSAVKNTLDTRTAKRCGGVSPTSFPNHVFGYGRVDALGALVWTPLPSYLG